MKRIAIAGAGCLLTLGLAIFAVALAQRVSRERESAQDTVDPEYTHQKPEPIAFPVAASERQDEPTNSLRTFVQPIMNTMPEDISIAPLDQSLPEHWPNDDMVNTSPFDESQMVLAAGQELLPVNNPGSGNHSVAATPPGLLSPPPTSNVPKLPRSRAPESNLQGLPTAGPTLSGPPAMLAPAPTYGAGPSAPSLNPPPPTSMMPPSGLMERPDMSPTTYPDATANEPRPTSLNPSSAMPESPKLVAPASTPVYPQTAPRSEEHTSELQSLA